MPPCAPRSGSFIPGSPESPSPTTRSASWTEAAERPPAPACIFSRKRGMRPGERLGFQTILSKRVGWRLWTPSNSAPQSVKDSVALRRRGSLAVGSQRPRPHSWHCIRTYSRLPGMGPSLFLFLRRRHFHPEAVAPLRGCSLYFQSFSSIPKDLVPMFHIKTAVSEPNTQTAYSLNA